MMLIDVEKRNLKFKVPAGTSRGVLTSKPSWFITLTDQNTGKRGIGECSIIPGLSIESEQSIDLILEKLSGSELEYNDLLNPVATYPSLYFAFEMALISIANKHDEYFEGPFLRNEFGIPVNGLVWMGEPSDMISQAREKIQQGYNCIKLKIGALDFQAEIGIIKKLRSEFESNLILRLDANGAFAESDALEKLKRLSEYNIHSIEQPVKAGQWELMAELCSSSPIPIALDEELIDVNDSQMSSLLGAVHPQYIILKPSLIGGFGKAEQWIFHAERMNVKWWATSALESNVGLNAIAQWTAKMIERKSNPLHQGLGTGMLYINNTPAKSEISSGKLYYKKD